MKILLLTDGIFPYVIGGMQKHSYYLTRFLLQRGHHITLVHCLPFGKTLPTHVEVCDALDIEPSENFRTIGIHFPKSGNQPGHYIRESFAYSEKISEAVSEIIPEFDFIYAKGFCAWKLLHLKSKGLKLPPVGVNFHGYEMFQKPANFKSWLQAILLRGPVKWNNRKSDFVFSYGGKITGIIRQIGIDSSNIIVIPTGVDAAWFRDKIKPTVKGDIQFVFVGRFERRKGVEEINQALKKLIDQTGFHFHFIGPIPSSKKVSHKQVSYHGALNDASALRTALDGCDILVVPSHSEGMPNVIMEGMARGLAIIATDVGAVASVVDDSNGWFAEPGNVDSLLQILRKALSAEIETLDLKKEASLSKIQAYTWQEIARMTEEIIESKLQTP